MQSLFQSAFFASDHAGFHLKEELREKWKNRIITFDLGAYSTDSVDYPDIVSLLCQELRNHKNSAGILICGSGIGVSIAANRYPFIRAALAMTPELAQAARSHNDANVLCLGERFMNFEVAKRCVEMFLTTPFEGGRHLSRLQKLSLPYLET